jgi:hypothetical protein
MIEVKRFEVEVFPDGSRALAVTLSFWLPVPPSEWQDYHWTTSEDNVFMRRNAEPQIINGARARQIADALLAGKGEGAVAGYTWKTRQAGTILLSPDDPTIAALLEKKRQEGRGTAGAP